MNKDVASSMKESADGAVKDDEGNEYVCSKSAKILLKGVVFGNEDDWEEEGIFGNGNLKEMNNVVVEVGAEDDWEDEG
eukprot:14629007-Ditylum_brightwellii.AAC.1